MEIQFNTLNREEVVGFASRTLLKVGIVDRAKSTVKITKMMLSSTAKKEVYLIHLYIAR